MRPLHVIALTFALAAAGGAPGCATTQSTRGNLTYGDRARRAYEEAREMMESGDLIEAAEAFRRIRREYGLSRWAWLAELRLADIDFRQERYSQAIQGYRSWIRYHPTQPEVPYAHFMIARSYFEEIPTDWALAPPSWDRDQSATHDAADAFARFLEDYPRSEHARAARDYLRRTRALLAQHEMSVAQFYHSRGRYEAAVNRLRGVLETYQGSGLEPEALLRMGETYLEMRRRAEARAAFQFLIARYPRSSYVESARRYLSFLGPAPAAPPAGAQAPSPTTPATGG